MISATAIMSASEKATSSPSPSTSPSPPYHLSSSDSKMAFAERAISAAGAALVSSIIVNPLDVAKVMCPRVLFVVPNLWLFFSSWPEFKTCFVLAVRPSNLVGFWGLLASAIDCFGSWQYAQLTRSFELSIVLEGWSSDVYRCKRLWRDPHGFYIIQVEKRKGSLFLVWNLC